LEHVAAQPFSSARSATSGEWLMSVALDPSRLSRSAVVIAWPVRSPTCSSRRVLAPPQRASR
jgi:hypothetical protein